MKRRILWIFAITLLSGCGLLHRKEAVQAPEAKQSPEVSAEVQEAARIYELMHSDELNALSEKIVASPSTDTYLERGDALLALAETENLYEAYHQARHDFEMAYYYKLEDTELDLTDRLYACYQAEAEHAEEADDLDAQTGWRERMLQIRPSKEDQEALLQLYKTAWKKRAGTEERTDFTNDRGEFDGYQITKYDENGQESECSTYDTEDNLVDTFTDYQFDEDGYLTQSATCDMDLKFRDYEVLERDEYDRQTIIRYLDIATGKEMGTSEIEYDLLGRPATLTTIDGYSGKVHSITEYLYDSDSAYIGMDTYDGNGYLLSHTVVDEEEGDQGNE